MILIDTNTTNCSRPKIRGVLSEFKRQRRLLNVKKLIAANAAKVVEGNPLAAGLIDGVVRQHLDMVPKRILILNE